MPWRPRTSNLAPSLPVYHVSEPEVHVAQHFLDEEEIDRAVARDRAG
jgi:hypothetical protein